LKRSVNEVFVLAAITATLSGAALNAASGADGSTASGTKADDTTTGASSDASSTKGLPTKDSHSGIQPGSPREKLKGPEEFPPDVVIKNSKGAGSTGPARESAGARALKDIKKQSSKTSDEKAFFKQWFEKFFSAIYYAKTLDELKPYFASRMTNTWDRMDVAPKSRLLDTIKQMRATDSSITTFLKSPSGYYEMTVEGTMVSMGNKGKGATYYRLMKEGGSFKIENFKGKAWARPRYYQD